MFCGFLFRKDYNEKQGEADALSMENYDLKEKIENLKKELVSEKNFFFEG